MLHKKGIKVTNNATKKKGQYRNTIKNDKI